MFNPLSLITKFIKSSNQKELDRIGKIVKKINSYSHTEHNTPLNNDKIFIEDCIKNEINFLDKNDVLSVNNDINKLPNYVKNNPEKFSEWIIKK